jgi:hypothetical protein
LEELPEFLESERKGLFSYGALKKRLESNRFETAEFRDLSQPVITLSSLKHDETYVLLQKLRNIHAANYGYESDITDEEIMSFMQEEYNRPGAEENMTAREIIRSFIGAMSILRQNPDYERSKLFGSSEEEEQEISRPNSGIQSRFSRTEG